MYAKCQVFICNHLFLKCEILVIHSMYCSHHVSIVNWWFGIKLTITYLTHKLGNMIISYPCIFKM
jgi:hypothetical protein